MTETCPDSLPNHLMYNGQLNVRICSNVKGTVVGIMSQKCRKGCKVAKSKLNDPRGTTSVRVDLWCNSLFVASSDAS